MEPELEDVLRALGAKKLDIMLKVGIPRTQPYLFGSLKVAITLAFVGTIVSETVGANAGLGYLIALAGSNFQVPLVFAALILLAVEGIAMYAVFAYDRDLFHPLGVPLLDERGGLKASSQSSGATRSGEGVAKVGGLQVRVCRQCLAWTGKRHATCRKNIGTVGLMQHRLRLLLDQKQSQPFAP